MIFLSLSLNVWICKQYVCMRYINIHLHVEYAGPGDIILYYLILQDRARFQSPWPQTRTHQLESPWGLIVPMWRQNVHQTQIKEQQTFARSSSRLANSVVVSLTQYSRLLTYLCLLRTSDVVLSVLACRNVSSCFHNQDMCWFALWQWQCGESCVKDPGRQGTNQNWQHLWTMILPARCCWS